MISSQVIGNSRKKGFTLIELVLYTGLLMLFLTAATTALWDIILGNVKSSVEQEVQENLRYGAHRIQFEIRNSDSINAGASSFGVNLATNPALKVSFAAPNPYNPVEFRVSEGVLEIKTGSGEWTALTSAAVEVTDLTLADLSDSDSENVEFTLTLRYKNPSGRSQWEKEATFEGAANLR
ncbi:hypothetical protein GTO10_05685 [Candidatus Saccharibacteria bacterium]|nr:hypothetical protein [Candidatus Saccharibacteria bacterium]